MMFVEQVKREVSDLWDDPMAQVMVCTTAPCAHLDWLGNPIPILNDILKLRGKGADMLIAFLSLGSTFYALHHSLNHLRFHLEKLLRFHFKAIHQVINQDWRLMLSMVGGLIDSGGDHIYK